MDMNTNTVKVIWFSQFDGNFTSCLIADRYNPHNRI